MKKLFMFAALLLCAIAANAQDSKWQLKAALGMATITGSDVDGAKSKLDWKLGVGYDIPVAEKISIQPALMFESKGYKVEDETAQMDYLVVPILLNYHFTEALSAQVGPYLGYGVAGTKDIFGDEGYNRFDMGGNIGIAYSFGSISVGAELNYGFLQLHKDLKANNLSYGVTLGYTL